MAKVSYSGDLSGVAGLIRKAAPLTPQATDEQEMAAINRYTLEPLNAEDVYTFRAVLCDNDTDRQYEHITAATLKDLQPMFLGRPVIKDHDWSADNQIARIYDVELETGDHAAESGELYTRLVAKCYMLRTAANADLIAEIKAGIRREGSVGFAVKSAICSICGTDNVQSYCRHYPGRNYKKDQGEMTCTFALQGGKDAYEFSLVAVPAQREAGMCKSYGLMPVYEPLESVDDENAKALYLRLRLNLAKAKQNYEEDDV